MLVEQATEAYCISPEAQGRALRTVYTNRERLKYLHTFLVQQSAIRIEDITPELIDQYIAFLYRNKLSVFTIAGRIQVIKTFFGWSVQRRYISESPASHLKKPRLNYKTNIKAIHQQDLEAIIQKARQDGKILEETMLVFLADTGCRSGELCSINISSLDFSSLEI